MTWKRWLHGLAAAAIGSLGTLTTTGIAGCARNYDLWDWDFWEPVVWAAGFNAWVAVKAYMKQFPPPGTLTPLSQEN